MSRHTATARQPSGHAAAHVLFAADPRAVAPPAADPVQDPEAHFDAPSDIVVDPQLPTAKKIAALDTWDEIAQMRLAAANEGMPANDKTNEDLAIIEEVAEARAELSGEPVPPSDPANPGRVVSGKAARAGSHALTNYRVLVNSALLLGLVAVALTAWWLNR
jgi:hypothetical protein